MEHHQNATLRTTSTSAIPEEFKNEPPLHFEQIQYQSGYKYKVTRRACFITDIFPKEDIETDFVFLSTSGVLVVKPGYAWDGASGPTIDTLNSMRASLLHDALYGMLRDKLLSGERIRMKADTLFYVMLRKDGMWKIRAKVWYKAVRRWAKRSSIIGRKLLHAPKRKEKL